MHIPDGYLGPETVAAGWAACAPAWYLAGRRARVKLTEAKSVPVLAAGAAFSFLVMMLNVPVFGGTTAHAVGATLIAIIAGPEIAILAVTAALVIQAVLFADGGVLTIGVNCFNMAVVMPLTGYAVYRLVAGASPLRATRRLVAAGLGAYAGIVAAATLVGVELGIQPALHTVNGAPEYAPYSLGTALTAMVGSHALIVGPIEAAFTVSVFAFLSRTSPQLFAAAGDRAGLRLRALYGVVALLVVAVPLGLLATGTAWGEWGAGEIGARVGYVPHGLARFGDLWSGIVPDYALPGHGGGVWGVVGYVLSALIGVALLAAAAWALSRLLRRRRGATTGDSTHRAA